MAKPSAVAGVGQAAKEFMELLKLTAAEGIQVHGAPPEGLFDRIG